MVWVACSNDITCMSGTALVVSLGYIGSMSRHYTSALVACRDFTCISCIFCNCDVYIIIEQAVQIVYRNSQYFQQSSQPVHVQVLHLAGEEPTLHRLTCMSN